MRETAITIAIDGYAACGKSSTAKQVARELGYIYIDTGAMYRAFTLAVLQKGIDLADLQAIQFELERAKIRLLPPKAEQLYTVELNGQDVSQEIRSRPVNTLVSEVSSIRQVREHMVFLQRQMGASKGVVMDGRDIGTVVFPDAELKVFMTAELEARVKRRKVDLEAMGQLLNEAEIRENLQKRDFQDTHRAESPLRCATDAREIDTTNLEFEEQVQKILDWVNELLVAESAQSSNKV